MNIKQKEKLNKELELINSKINKLLDDRAEVNHNIETIKYDKNTKSIFDLYNELYSINEELSLLRDRKSNIRKKLYNNRYIL